MYKPCFGAKEVMIDQCFVDTSELAQGEIKGVVPLTARPRLLPKEPQKTSWLHLGLFKG